MYAPKYFLIIKLFKLQPNHVHFIICIYHYYIFYSNYKIDLSTFHKFDCQRSQVEYYC
jgi:hypothetical protein